MKTTSKILFWKMDRGYCCRALRLRRVLLELFETPCLRRVGGWWAARAARAGPWFLAGSRPAGLTHGVCWASAGHLVAGVDKQESRGVDYIRKLERYKSVIVAREPDGDGTVRI